MRNWRPVNHKMVQYHTSSQAPHLMLRMRKPWYKMYL